jgi:hypothetical protein
MSVARGRLAQYRGGHHEPSRNSGARKRWNCAALAGERRLSKIGGLRQESKRQLGRLTKRDLFIAGVVAYAAEGAKQKPWQPSAGMKFANSDPRMIMMFVQWLHLIGIDAAAIEFRLHIHRSADVESALKFWVEFLVVQESDSSGRYSSARTRSPGDAISERPTAAA